MLIFLAVAGIQLLVFRRYRRRFLEHIVLGLSVATFYILVVAVGELALIVTRQTRIGPIDGLLRQGVGGTLLPIYWFFAIRRFYGARAWRAARDTIFVTTSQVVIAISMNIGIFALLAATAAMPPAGH